MASKGMGVSSASSGKGKCLNMAEKLGVIEAYESGVSRAQLMAQYDLEKQMRQVMKKVV